MQTLPHMAHEHHDVLLPLVDELAAVAATVGSGYERDVMPRLRAVLELVKLHLVPHMDRAEAVLYPELERLLQNRHSMTPMRAEHDEVRRKVAELSELEQHSLDFGARRRLRRLLYELYATIQIHLAEEEAYLAVLGGNLSAPDLEALARAMDHPGFERA